MPRETIDSNVPDKAEGHGADNYTPKAVKKLPYKQGFYGVRDQYYKSIRDIIWRAFPKSDIVEWIEDFIAKEIHELWLKAIPLDGEDAKSDRVVAARKSLNATLGSVDAIKAIDDKYVQSRGTIGKKTTEIFEKHSIGVPINDLVFSDTTKWHGSMLADWLTENIPTDAFMCGRVIALNDQHGYCDLIGGIICLNDKTYIVKARLCQTSYEDHALEMAALVNCTHIYNQTTDVLEAMPHIDGTLVIEIRDDRIVPSEWFTGEAEFEAWKALMVLAEWKDSKPEPREMMFGVTPNEQ